MTVRYLPTSRRKASTRFDMEFYNPNPRRIEGSFLFPLPRGAAVEKFTENFRKPLVRAVREAFVPVSHTIQIVAE